MVEGDAYESNRTGLKEEGRVSLSLQRNFSEFDNVFFPVIL